MSQAFKCDACGEFFEEYALVVKRGNYGQIGLLRPQATRLPPTSFAKREPTPQKDLDICKSCLREALKED